MKVVHCKREKFDVYVGRPTKWGNPFVIGVNGNREQVIELYKNWLLRQPELVEEAKKHLRGKVLACWCAPAPCHGDVLASVANEEPEVL